MPLDIAQDPWAAFQGLADKPVFLTVNDKPRWPARAKCWCRRFASEARLRHLAWIEKNRRKVDEASGGKIGYVYVPDTGQQASTNCPPVPRRRFDKAGMIIDERFNSGGQVPDRFIELLARKTSTTGPCATATTGPRRNIANSGPKAMLINGWSGSGGDCFPFYFKQAGLGPLIGHADLGRLDWHHRQSPGLIDGGAITVPTFGIYSTNGEWIIEGHGVDPTSRWWMTRR